jgi:uncharacterized protein YidB (DUF937 family)
MTDMIAQKVFGVLAAAAIAGSGAAAVSHSTTALAADGTGSNAQKAASHPHSYSEPYQKAASILGIDVNTLKSELKSGQSLVQVAQSKGVSEQTLISDLEAPVKERLDQAVANGKITADKENELLAKAQTRIQKFVEHKGLIQPQKRLKQGLMKEVASLLGMDVKTLRSDLQAGHSIADLAQSKGISEQTLISDLQAKIKERLDQAVAKGKLTADQETKLLSKSSTYLQKFVEKKHASGQGQQS